jgi:SRSO17 transposase
VVRDDVRGAVLAHLGAPPGGGIDETGFLKTGRHAAGVARQESGPAGRGAHCQIGVLRADARARGQALLDGALSRPQEWPHARERCAQAGLPQDRAFATQPERAQRMLERACKADGPAAWGTGASVAGETRRLRMGGRRKNAPLS